MVIRVLQALPDPHAAGDMMSGSGGGMLAIKVLVAPRELWGDG